MAKLAHIDPPMTQATRDTAAWVASFDTGRLSAETLARGRHAVLDWVGVTVAGSSDPMVDILTADAIDNGEAGECTLVGRGEHVTQSTAALINGTASHALDFDDVNRQLHGHPTVAVLPAVLALAEQRHASGREMLDAFIVGYQVACAVGEMMDPSHYEAGWHATGTAGTFGAAAGAARLLGLDAGQCAHALGIAATQAAGLKAMFGTMCKPLHAGKAAMNGLLAARWAARGFTSNQDALEAHQGFAHTQTTTFEYRPLPASAESPLAVESGLYKYHAACYLTHASIEAIKAIVAEHAIQPDDVKQVRLHALPTLKNVCNIAVPDSGLEIKFSIRHLAAMALSGVDTANLAMFSDHTARRADLVALRERIELVEGDLPNRVSARVEVTTRQGNQFDAFVDVGTPHADTAAQWSKLNEKFQRLVGPVLGESHAVELSQAIGSIETCTDVAMLAGSFGARPV